MTFSTNPTIEVSGGFGARLKSGQVRRLLCQIISEALLCAYANLLD